MDNIKIYLNKEIYFFINKSEFNYMLEHNIIKKVKSRYFIEKNSDFFYLFNDKTSVYKKRRYIISLSKQSFICSICGKEHSYSISPLINDNNEVDFNTILCCCKECRLNKLKKRKIIQPIYKQKINWKKEIARIKENYKKYDIQEKYEKEYMYLCKKIIVFERYRDLVLPKRNLSKFKNFGEEIDLNNLQLKYEYKVKLYEDLKGICPICGEEIEYNKFTLDHVVAKKLGGQDNTNNLIGMCDKCNKEKDSKTVLEFLIEKELFNMPDLILYIAKQQQIEIKKILNTLYYKRNLMKTKKF